MIKRLVSALTVIMLIFTLGVTASSEGLPFESVKGAPEKLYFMFSYPNEGSESIEVIFTVPDEICELKALTSEQQEKFYGSAFECCVQYDWSVDSDKAWNYNATWDTADGDYLFQRLTGSFVEKQELFWFTYDEAAERCKGAVKSETSDDGVTVRKFDFDNHSLYVRARFFILEYSTGECHIGDWSDVYFLNDYFDGKKVPEKYKGDEKGVSPKVSSVKFNDDNSVTFDVSFDDSVKEQAYLLKCSGNPDFTVESQVRINDGEWQYWILGNELYPYVVGTRVMMLNDSYLQGKFEYKCRMIFNEVNDIPGYNSGWSDIITIENGKATIVKNDDPFDEKETDNQAEKEKKCSVCGFCPVHPFGICMFIWIGIIVLVILIIVYNVIMAKKKKEKQSEIEKRQELSRASGNKEESIINIDLTPKIKNDSTEENKGE